MTAMFRPPIAESKRIGWAEVFGFNHGRDHFSAAVRAAQLANISRYVSFNVGCVAVNLGALAVVLRGTGDPAVLAAFAAALIGLMVVWLAGWIERRERGGTAPATRTDTFEVALKILAFGVLWSLFMLYILPRASAAQQVYLSLLSLLSLGVMGTCSFATSVLPLCSAVLVTMIATAAFLGVPSGGPVAVWPVQLCIATFAVAIVRGVMVTSFSMMAQTRTEAEHDEQAAVIGLLLSEFEENGSDWLFELDAGRPTSRRASPASPEGRSRRCSGRTCCRCSAATCAAPRRGTRSGCSPTISRSLARFATSSCRCRPAAMPAGGNFQERRSTMRAGGSPATAGSGRTSPISA